MRFCGYVDCAWKADFQVSVPSYQQDACSIHLTWAVLEMSDSPVRVEVLIAPGLADAITRTLAGEVVHARRPTDVTDAA